MLYCQKSLYISTTLTTRYNMTTDNQKPLKDENMRIRGDKRKRIKEAKRNLAAVENRDISDTSLLDEAVDKGLAIIERRIERLKRKLETV